MIEQLIPLIQKLSETAKGNLSEIQHVTSMTRMLSINALIEAAHAGDNGRSFAVVAQEVARVSESISAISKNMDKQFTEQLSEVDRLSKEFGTTMRGLRLAELSLNMIEIIDRNLYERSCDVRWWATDSAVVDCVAQQESHRRSYASQRLGVILDSYTVYLDICILDTAGNVLAHGRPQKFPDLRARNFATARWFVNALATRDGTEFAVADIAVEPGLGRTVATYATAIREGGQTGGRPLGVLVIWFDWQTQAQSVVTGVHLSAAERPRTRCLLVDSTHRVIGASDGKGLLTEIFPLAAGTSEFGSYLTATDDMIGYALTPGYETYPGLGWYGVVVQSRSASTPAANQGDALAIGAAEGALFVPPVDVVPANLAAC